MLATKRLVEINLRNPLHTDNKAQKPGVPPWQWNPGQVSPEVRKRGNSGPKNDFPKFCVTFLELDM